MKINALVLTLFCNRTNQAKLTRNVCMEIDPCEMNFNDIQRKSTNDELPLSP